MTQTNPNPNPTHDPGEQTPEFRFLPGDLEPIAEAPKKKFPPKLNLPKFINPNLLKQAFRPMLLGALGIHGLLLFTPLTSPQQVKPKETAEPVKLNRLSDKVLVKSMPKVKIATLPNKTKLNLPKVAVASTNSIAIKAPTPPEEPKSEEKKPEEKKSEKPTEKSPQPSVTPSGSSNQGLDPSKLKDPSKGTMDAKDASKLDAETQKFAPIINGLNKQFNPNEETAPVPEAEQLTDPAPFFKVNPAPVTGAVISNQEVDAVVSGLQSSFSGQFTPKGNYAGTALYEVKVEGITRYISVVKADNVIGQNVLVFLWAKPPA